ncbi:MAG: hypothetical protein HY760_04780 [Nitrospirae bacterium]|nr:hypothetical protein [Nitrospirota bacterium]
MGTRASDTVTHTLIGVGLGNAFFRRRIGPPALVILAVASNLPDVDADGRVSRLP